MGRRILPEFRLLALLSALVLLCGLRLSAAEPRFTASLDRESVVVGESVGLTLQFEGGAPRALPSIPQIPGLLVAPGMSRDIRTSIGPDGAMNATQSYILTLVARQAGEFVIPALTAEVEGRKLQSQPLKLKVLQSDPAAPPAESAEQLAFLSLVLPKRQVYVGEVFVAELRLCFRSDVRNYSGARISDLAGDGFTSSGKFTPGQEFQRRIGNAVFNIIPHYIALTPIKTGDFALGPLNGSVVVYVPASRPRQPSPFDFDSFLGRQTEPKQVSWSVERQNLQVLPLPSDKVPAGFSGAVGNYTMAFSAGPTNVAVGDPITIKLQISGQGSLEALSLPQQAWQAFKAYPPTSRVEPRDQLGVQGTKFFEQVVVPQSADIKELPPFSFSFFDPDQKAYRTLTQPAVPLIVRPSGSTPAPAMLAAARGGQDNSPPPVQDIVPNKQRLGALAQIGPPLLLQQWFLALQGIPVLAFVSALIWRKRIEKLANNPRLRRQRQVAQIVREGLDEMRQLAAANQSEEFFAALFRLLQEQLGERLDLPASAITEAVVEERLRPLSVPDSTLMTLQTLFQTCNLARYAPVKTSQELAAIIPEMETVLRELQNLKL